jgi:hypothetical protein
VNVKFRDDHDTWGPTVRAAEAHTDPKAWEAVWRAMGSQWHGRGIPTPKDTTACVFIALREAGFKVVPEGTR